jgi:beta-lactamase regulating signal transducer with metallopeptidase domain
MTFIPDTILRAICWTLLHSLWQGLIFAIVAGIVLVLTKKASSSLRYNLLCCGMILFLAVSGYTFYRQLHIPAAPEGPVAGNLPAVTGGWTTTATTPVITTGTNHTPRNGIDSLVRYFNTHASLVVVIWFIIFLARFVQVLSGVVYTQRIRHYQTSAAPSEWQQRLTPLLHRLQIKRPVSLLQSGLVKVPMVVGWLKPVILVPIGMLAHISPEQVESILLHELAHIRRQDYVFNLVQHVVDTLFFFNPALLWISSLIRTERENCCDDIAIRQTNSRRRLIEALVSFHEYRQSAQAYALSLTGKNNGVVRRVERIVHRKNHSLNAGERLLLMCGLMTLSVAFITIDSSRQEAPASPVRPAVTQIQIPALPPSAPAVTSPASASDKGILKPAPMTVSSPSKLQPERTQPDTTHPGTTEDGSPDLLDELKSLGYHDISVDQLIRCKEHGVTGEFIADLRKLGYKTFSLDKAVELVDHGVSAEFINSLHHMGYTDISLDMAVRLVDHGVTTDFISSIRKLGFDGVSLEKAIRLADHGVTSDFIASWKNKTGKLFELDDYIKLHDSGIDPS